MVYVASHKNGRRITISHTVCNMMLSCALLGLEKASYYTYYEHEMIPSSCDKVPSEFRAVEYGPRGNENKSWSAAGSDGWKSGTRERSLQSK